MHLHVLQRATGVGMAASPPKRTLYVHVAWGAGNMKKNSAWRAARGGSSAPLFLVCADGLAEYGGARDAAPPRILAPAHGGAQSSAVRSES